MKNLTNNINCLGHTCEHAILNRDIGQDDAGLVLWCGKAESAVFDLAACPLGCWNKQSDGIDLFDKRQRGTNNEIRR